MTGAGPSGGARRHLSAAAPAPGGLAPAVAMRHPAGMGVRATVAAAPGLARPAGAGARSFEPAAAGSERSAELWAAVARRITIAMLLAHGLGALDVFALLWWVLPLPPHDDSSSVLTVNLIVFAAGFPVFGVLGTWLGHRVARAGRGWLDAGRAPTEAERRAVLREPLRCALLDAGLWTAGAALFAAINVPSSLELACHVATTILLGGLTTCAVGYLLVERLLRPVTALVLSFGPPPRLVGPGVQGRLVLAWAFATGVPLLGLVLLALHVLVDGGVSAERVAAGVLALALAALGVGLIAAVFAARSVADPVSSVRAALARLEAGDLDARVRVDDGSEIGLLQSGFNQMAAGLRERERLRDVFGRHVGEDVARAALEDGGVRLGGEVREVAVLFVDLIGSTALAASEPPERVVALLNRFFALVVAVVDEHGGWVDGFEGDGALCVFGAPAPHPDAAGATLAAARELRARLARELPALDAGIGLSAGEVVAGNVGTERRMEYTVIGDPVNEAARLCELAKRTPERVLACASVLERAGELEAARWRLDRPALLRGRTAETRLAVPA